MRACGLASFAVGWLLIGFGSAGRAELRVWTVLETRHVLRSELPSGSARVKISAARNEWAGFQIMLRSDVPVSGVGLEPGVLKGPRGFAIDTRQLRLYRQHQLYLETGTYRNDTFKPDWYPDPLMPFNDPTTGRRLQGARLTAVPFELPANETHGFWVDLLVPTNAPTGEYTGVYEVTVVGGRSVRVPVSLTVWNFTLPQTPTLVTEFGSPRLRDYYRQRAKTHNEPEPTNWETVETQCAELLSEHRFNATPPREILTPKAQPDGSFEIPSRQVNALRDFVAHYHLNAVMTPHPSAAVKDPEAERDRLRAWLAAFDRAAKQLNRPGLLFYTYLKDEPNTLEDYRYVQKWGRVVREAKSVVKVLVVEQPWTEPGNGGADSAWGDLYGAVDIWCPLFSLHRQEAAAKRQALGEAIWTYTALCQGPPTPWWHIDFPVLNYRVPTWMAWRDGMTGLLYWGGMSYWRQTEDPWTKAPFYTGSGRPQQGKQGIIFNGEGSLVYPARAVGYDGVVPTIRLKALRDGIEDFEYLATAARLGKAAEAQRLVRSLTESFFQWNKDPVAYESARAELARLIVSAAKSAKRVLPRDRRLVSFDPTPMEIRRFRLSDEESVIALWRRCDLVRPWNDSHKDIQRKLRIQPELFLVGTLDGEIVATTMAGYEGHRGWLSYVAVAPEYQRCGFGRAIVAEAECLLRAAACLRINLQVRTSNSTAIEFYRRLGYGVDDVVSMGKRLEEDAPKLVRKLERP